ncbi:nuclear transport factor 2 family protein (plasmid) [Agrobacterium leguminum]|uniref:nuclear transport factor 2 family protein n=1 Tax=Agrobacterium TaxID=357 RepID=UPI0009BB7672|nr:MULTISPECIES: nuclear transport factor 2 family protein [Agrobacterium]WFS69723.1 nuclear transport factor 2 family protein [Agrobacterium leguminum]
MQEDRLQYLADRLAISDVLAACARYLDEYDIDAVGERFTDDCMMDQGPGRGGPIRGREAVVAGMKTRQARFRRTNHHLGQSIVEISGDTADATTYVHAWHETWDGLKQEAKLRYRDKLKRSADGRWRISERTSQAMGVDGFEEAMWHWVERLPPVTE